MRNRQVIDDAVREAQDRDRFGALPERVPFEAMVAERPVAARNPISDDYYAERSWRHGACAALDAGV